MSWKAYELPQHLAEYYEEILLLWRVKAATCRAASVSEHFFVKGIKGTERFPHTGRNK